MRAGARPPNPIIQERPRQLSFSSLKNQTFQDPSAGSQTLWLCSRHVARSSSAYERPCYHPTRDLRTEKLIQPLSQTQGDTNKQFKEQEKGNARSCGTLMCARILSC
jgi:hypothetical protein